MIALLALAALTTDAQIERAIAAAPRPVRAFIERRQGCNHWAGEEPYDADRRREIEAAIRGLRCTAIEADARAIRRRYSGQSDILRLLARTADWGY